MSSSLSSMTGFARRDGHAAGHAWTVEARSVNGKGLDLRLRLPTGYELLDPMIRQLANERLKRGNVTISLSLRRDQTGTAYKLNRDMALAVLALAKELEMLGGPPQRLDALLAVRGVVEGSDETAALDEPTREAIVAGMRADLAVAMDELLQARQAEGERLLPTLCSQLDEITRLHHAAGQTAAARPEALRERMKAQLALLLEHNPPVSEERLAQELALQATRSDIREELDRLAAHIVAARGLLASASGVGRKLDFLCQEFNREANTLCSKSGDVELTRIGLDLKVVIDQFREQVQNIE